MCVMVMTILHQWVCTLSIYKGNKKHVPLIGLPWAIGDAALTVGRTRIKIKWKRFIIVMDTIAINYMRKEFFLNASVL